MSSMERNKGRLIPTRVDTELFAEGDFEYYMEEGFYIIDGEVYEVEWQVKGDTKFYEEGFAEVAENPDGSISFHTFHHNGGACWSEIVEMKLK